MMNKILAEETLIEGNWVFENNKMHRDETCKRVEWLASSILKKIGTDESGWDTLYRDPKDNRYWVHYYPQSEMHGGGPPSNKR